jgi:hypothetical protein
MVNNRKNAVFQKTVRSYQKGKAQYEALKEELQRFKGTALHFHCLLFLLFWLLTHGELAAVVANPAEVQSLREQLAEAQSEFF